MENQDKPDLRAELLKKAHETSTSSGVYLMKSQEDGVLYVGKAKNLKNRLTTYFQPAKHGIFRTELMVQRVVTFEVILTETESEALILEWTLIKKYKPMYNVRLKDDKSYPYLKIQNFEQDPFPKIEWTRKVQKDGARYFGPFPSSWSARQVLGLLNETFKLRDCSDNTFRHRSRPCILYQINKCHAPCVGKISQEDYQTLIRNVMDVLDGKSKQIFDSLKTQMDQASQNEDYEDAAYFRDQLKNLELVTQTQVAIDAGSKRNLDVFGLASDKELASGCVLQIRSGYLIAIKHFTLQNFDSSLGLPELLSDMISQYYVETQRKEAKESGSDEELVHHIDLQTLVPELPKDQELLEKSLRLNFKTAESDYEKQLISVAHTNSQHAVEQAQKKVFSHGIKALEEVQDKLNLPKLPTRIECFDISNIQGDDAVASRVVFIEGAPDKSLYRRYKIKTIQGANDFAMMKEVLSRRFASLGKVGDEKPDLVVVDGGKGQLSQALAILEELNLQGVEVVGLAKARTEKDFQSKEVRSSLERIFLPNRKNPVSLYPSTEAHQLLTHLRDEAHRFAISYHRTVRSKRILNSES